MAVKTTQRAYTLRLTGIDHNDQTWRENLWRTHEAVNKSAKAFGVGQPTGDTHASR